MLHLNIEAPILILILTTLLASALNNPLLSVSASHYHPTTGANDLYEY